ncbi:MAG: hypothetical protein GOMPHAMPRED_007733 [Gomphillus americanus]|uniref:Uncharacterized protein n=1 Tax=Gomphillus americanus TaxID=1940652 RepID=A0A8H3EW11_9LECA|nr:MAG: hypothetical protein GOMPHAMPRED_007733 [Gomphillus americanus]
MFLDRFSAPSNSAGSSQRSFSPASRPRQPPPSALQRAPTNPRSLSVTSLLSRTNSSTSSLPGALRLPNGSGLRQSTIAPPDTKDPILILQDILGVSLAEVDTKGDTENEDTPVLIEDIDFGGLSLDGYLKEYGQEELSQEGTQFLSVKEYDQKSDTLEDLHKSIQACDNVLRSVEISLAGFQRDLGSVSTEIETLQTKSTILNTRLENRKVVEEILGPAVEEISIAPSIVKNIIDGQIDEAWLKSLAELQKRIKVNDSKNEGLEAVKAAADIKPLLDGLTTKAIERIRDYLVAQIKAIRSPNINVQIIQQQRLLKFKDGYVFLTKNNAQLAEEIGRAYVNTMRWYYLTHFTRYQEALNKLAVHRIGQLDTLGSDPTVSKTKPAGMSSTTDIYNIGRRGELLKNYNAPAVTSYLAEEDKSTHYIETPFRSFNVALLDNLSSEYSFLAEFFSTDSFSQLSKRCAGVFEPTFNLGQSLVSDLVATSYDCLGILICVRLNQRFAFEVQRRKVPVAETYLNAINMLLWPRLQVAMDAHSESIKQLATTVSSRSAASKLSFTGASTDASKLTTTPHYLTQRVAQFLYGILAVSRDASDDEPVAHSLRRLVTEYDVFLQKAGKAAGADPKKRDRFLSNNYALILAIIADAEGKLAEEHKRHFEELNAKVDKT